MPDLPSSQEAVGRKILATTLQEPVTLYSTGLGLLGGLGGALFGGWLFPAVAAGGLLLGGGSWAYNYYGRRQQYLDRALQGMDQERIQKNAELMENVKKVMGSAPVKKCAPDISEQGLQQHRLIQDRYQALKRLLDKRLEPSELTYSRFLSTAQEVYFSVLDNLQQVAEIMEAAAGIDTDYIAARQKSLGKIKSPDKADKDEVATLKERSEIQRSQFQQAEELLTQNEEALTEIENATTKLAAIRTKKGLATIDLDATLKDLEQLAARSKSLAVNK